MSIFDFFKKGAKHSETKAQPQQEPQSKTESAGAPQTEDCVRVHNLLILDESGSMQGIYMAALSGVNETLQTIRSAHSEHPEQEHFVTLVTFDTGHYNRIYHNTPAEQATDISEIQYRPNGGTPLYDAMGYAINELRPKVVKDDVVLVTIITDGLENASREYSDRAIKSLVEAMKADGWVFTYIGANQDVEAVAAAMSIDNHFAFDANYTSTREMFSKDRGARRRFFSRINQHPDSSRKDLNKGYFDDFQ